MLRLGLILWGLGAGMLVSGSAAAQWGIPNGDLLNSGMQLDSNRFEFATIRVVAHQK